MNELAEFDAKLARWALTLAGPLWMSTAIYKLAQPEASIFGGVIFFGVGLLAFVAGIYTWRHL